MILPKDLPNLAACWFAVVERLLLLTQYLNVLCLHVLVRSSAVTSPPPRQNALIDTPRSRAPIAFENC